MSANAHEFERLRRRARNRRRRGLTIKRIVIWLIIITVLAPGYFIVLASLQPGSSFFTGIKARAVRRTAYDVPPARRSSMCPLPLGPRLRAPGRRLLWERAARKINGQFG